MKLSIREAFDLTATKEVKIGDRTYTVPPLTFGRLDQLLGAHKNANVAALTAFQFDIKEQTPEAIGRALADFPIEEFAGAAAAVVPGMTIEEWKEKGNPFVFLTIAGFLAKVHDWAFISEHLFGKGDADSTAPDVSHQTSLVLMAQALGCQITELLDLRAEGFFSCVDAIKEKRVLEREAIERQESDAEGWERLDPAAAVPIQSGNREGLDALIADAELKFAQARLDGPPKDVTSG